MMMSKNIWPWLHYKTTAWRRQTVPSAPLCWSSSPSSWWFAPISCGALNNDNADDENTDDDGEKEDQIEDGGGDGGKRGVLYILYIIYNDCVALIISQGTSECSPITSLLGFLWRETKSLFPVVLRLRSGFGVAAGPPRLDGQVQIYSRSKWVGEPDYQKWTWLAWSNSISPRGLQTSVQIWNKLTSDNKQSVATSVLLKFSFF